MMDADRPPRTPKNGHSFLSQYDEPPNSMSPLGSKPLNKKYISKDTLDPFDIPKLSPQSNNSLPRSPRFANLDEHSSWGSSRNRPDFASSPVFRPTSHSSSSSTSNIDYRRYKDSPAGSPQSPYNPQIYTESTPESRPAASSSSTPRSPSPTRFLEDSDTSLLGKSSSIHFRNLAKNAQIGGGSVEIPGVTSHSEDVTGLQGRLRLQKSDSCGSGEISQYRVGAGSMMWMDSQRKNIQAYEYLCHIGEAKEWIETCTGERIPPVVQLEEELRNGFILANLTKKFAPGLVRKIHAPSPDGKLQYKHTENINYFFKFLEHVGMPELFTFELTDLYDRKNIPKVIHCVHALGSILSGQGLAPPIGDLVGKLEFTDDELAKAQRRIDASGVSLPNFDGMNRHLSDDRSDYLEQIESEDEEPLDEIASPYILELQALCRGALCRNDLFNRKYMLSHAVDQILTLQSAARGYMMRDKMEALKETLALVENDVIEFQCVCRGSMARLRHSYIFDQACLDSELTVELQSLIRGISVRQRMLLLTKALGDPDVLQQIIFLQSYYRGTLVRNRLTALDLDIKSQNHSVANLQSLIRASLARKSLAHTIDKIQDSKTWVCHLQSACRGALIRSDYRTLQADLCQYDQTMTDFNSIVRGSLVRANLTFIKNSLIQHSHSVLRLQSAARAKFLRQELAKDAEALELFSPSIIRLQALIRGILLRFEQSLLFEDLEAEEFAVVAFQAAARGYLVRKSFRDRMRYYEKHLDKVIKVQSIFRAKRQGDAYKSLVTSTNPPLSTVKNFVHLLNDSDLDFEQEVELEQRRKNLAEEVHKNEMLEQFITQLDVKIALLLKNKITLDSFVSHRDRGARELLTRSKNADLLDLKALNKSSRRRLELYQGLFYILQTQPKYFARVLNLFGTRAPPGYKGTEATEVVNLVAAVFSLQKPTSLTLRESYHLNRLLSAAIRAEVAVCESYDELLTEKCMIWPLLRCIMNSLQERELACKLITPMIQSIIDDPNLNFESDPLTIYRSLINIESYSHGASTQQKDPNVSVAEAIKDPAARKAYVTNMQQLRDSAIEYLRTFDEIIEDLPYYVRFLSREFILALKDRFPNHFNDVMSSARVAGAVIIQKYLDTALANYEAPKSLNSTQKKNVAELRRVMSQISTLHKFGRDDVFLQPLNDSLTLEFPNLAAKLLQASDVADPEIQFNFSPLDDLVLHRRPALQIKTSEAFALHALVAGDIDLIAPEQDDSLREVIKELGTIPNDAGEMLSMARFTNVKLELNSNFCQVQDAQAETNTLLVTAKHYLLYVLRVQSGFDLMDIMVAPITQEHEDKYKAILREECLERRETHQERRDFLGDLARCVSPFNCTTFLTSISYRELKLLALEKLIELESIGKISRDDQYQALLNSIALDIRTKHNRRLSRAKELESVEKALYEIAKKEEYLQNKLKTYNDYISQAMSTLQSKSKKKTAFPFTKQFFHMRELQKNGVMPKFGSYKYSAANLLDKGVLTELRKYTPQQYDRVMFTFSSNEVSVFTIEASYQSIVLPGASIELTLDDLLGQQYNSKPLLELFDGMAKFNTDLLLHLIFRKFYGGDHQ